MSGGVILEKVTGAIRGALEEAKQRGQLKLEAWPQLSLDAPKRPEWGDLASTVAMTMASSERRAPHDIAQIIADNLPHRDQLFDRVDVVRPGFLNFTLKREMWYEVLREIEHQGPAYGTAMLHRGQRALVEYVSANPTGPLHVGHGRGAAVGQAVANLLRAVGYDVVSEYYINDAGRQMKLLGSSTNARYLELLGRPVSFPEDGYRGEYIKSVAEQLRQEYGERLADVPASEAERQCRDFAYKTLLEQIKRDLRSFGIEFESWFSEASLLSSQAVERVLEELRQKDLLFEEEGAVWFRSSKFGDEKDRVVRKQDGEYTYLASDIAYHRDKLLRGYNLLVDVWGADHHGYIPRMEAVMQAYGHPKDRLRVVLVQMVNLLRGGKKVEMSKRAGEFVTMREVLDEVGSDAAKFFFLMRDSDSHLDFDLDLAKQRSADNPVYYVQYAHARISSLWRVARDRGIARPAADEADLTALTDPDELSLIRKLAAYPMIVQSSALSFEPHRLTYYLRELAALLHTFYNKHRILPSAGEAEPHETSMDAEGASEHGRRDEIAPPVTAARLALMRGVQLVVRNGLAILGVSAPEQM